MEKVVVKCLREYLEANSILSRNQFGFRPGRSTMEQLLLVYDNVAEVIDVILFDYSKAFDVVCPEILLKKLQSIGIVGKLLDWIGSSLVGRTMRVCVKGKTSSERTVLSGVPQGSVLCPLLFDLY